MATNVHVNRGNLAQTELADGALPPLGDGEARLRVESFAVTANNVTYAVIGDMFGYWNFFPAPEGFGIVPMWGHAVVEDSTHPDIAAGERVYGYLPMGTHVDVLPDKISAGMFTDAAAHRQPMSAIYNQYRRLAADPAHDPAREAQRMLFQPLFTTSFLIESMFRLDGWYGADTLVMTSASSKTALALANVARAKSPGIRRVGLTSNANMSFVRGSGQFDEVLSYDEIGKLAGQQAVLVDFAGNGGVLRQVHETLGDDLKYSCLVGATHVSARGGAETTTMPGPQPILFFAPDHATGAIKHMGADAFNAALGEAWADFLLATDRMLTVDERQGLQAAADAYVDTLRGAARPDLGIVIRP